MMLPFLVAALTASTAAQNAPITLARTFTLNQKQAYQVQAHLHIEHREGMVQTFIPEDVDVSYGFTTITTELRPEGIAVLRYNRPTMTEVQGETFNEPSKTSVEKLNIDSLLTVSPINEILEVKDLTKKTPPKKKGSSRVVTPAARQQSITGFLGQFVQDVYRMSVCIGSVSDGLDFSPKLPLKPVAVGDTWKRTIGYQPQKLKGKDGKQAVQRVDYTFTYKGLVDSEGKKVYRIQAQTDLNTDLAEFFHQLVELKPEDTGLKKFALKLKTTIDFDLDPKTKTTLRAVATSDGGYEVFTTDETSAIIEEKLKGKTTYELIGSKIVKPSR